MNSCFFFRNPIRLGLHGSKPNTSVGWQCAVSVSGEDVSPEVGQHLHLSSLLSGYLLEHTLLALPTSWLPWRKR